MNLLNRGIIIIRKINLKRQSSKELQGMWVMEKMIILIKIISMASKLSENLLMHKR